MRRYAEKDLAPVEKRHSRTFRRVNDLGGPTRRECWGARTLDGLWDIERTEDVGTPWVIGYLPTGEQAVGCYGTHGTLASARHAIARGQVFVPSMLAQQHSARPDHLATWDELHRYCPGCQPDGHWRLYVNSRQPEQIGAP